MPDPSQVCKICAMNQPDRTLAHWTAYLTAVVFLLAVSRSSSGQTSDETRAAEVMRSIQQQFWDQRQGAYIDPAGSNKIAAMWACGVVLSDLNGAVRHDRAYQPTLSTFVATLNRYWDGKQKIPGYEPFPSNGDGHDKYYDDNAWVAIALLETYAQTQNAAVLQRSAQVVDFVRSGWDDELGGGIYWHEKHKANSKNTCSNAPAAVACLRLARYLPPAAAADQRKMAQRIVDWTVANLQDDKGLYYDNKKVDTQRVDRGELSYNSALMIRAQLELFQATGNPASLAAAKRTAAAADRFVRKSTGGYGNPIRFSHLLVEADLEMYRADGDAHLLDRARHAVDVEYAAWKADPSRNLLDVGALARELWLLADLQTPAGKAFWAKVDGPMPQARPDGATR